MGFRAVRSWTLSGLIVAFVELAIAYTLLCGSAFAFIPSKILSFFGLYFPCPCSGFFGYKNNDLCFHRLLIDWPIRKIITVQELAKNRFPFDLIWFEHQSCNVHVEGVGIRTYANGSFELGEEACSSSISGSTWQCSVDKESGCDSKGKKVMNQKQKSGIRRRRRSSLGYGKFSPALSSTRTCMPPVSIGLSHSLYESSSLRSQCSESLDPGNGIEDGFLGDQNAPNRTDFSESMRHCFEFDGSYCKGEDISRGSFSVEKLTCNAEDKLCSTGNDVNVIRVLRQALEEEKSARAALYQELEKERAAAATAADETMAMILRLQGDKASIEMEARQYHRVIEEKFAYDEEEMNILKEILVRREQEIHFLEKELEAYEHMDYLGSEQVEGDLSYKINNKEQGSSLSADSKVNPPPVMQHIMSSKSTVEMEVGTSGKWLSDYDHGHILALGEEMVSKEFASNLSTSRALVQKTASVIGKEGTERDIWMISPVTKATHNCGITGEELEEDQNQAGGNVHSSMLDTESTVYDVHVVDDTAKVQNSKLLVDCPTVSKAKIEPIIRESSFDMHSKSVVSGNSQCKTLTIDSQRHSPSPVDDERLKIDNEVEWLRERLRIVQEEKEKLTFSAEHRKRVSAQLKLVEDVVNQLREIQQLKEPTRHSSLPPSSSKASLKKRHHRSASYENFGSD